MGNKFKRKRRLEFGTGGAQRVSDIRQLQTRGILPRDFDTVGGDIHPPIDGLAWTEHARKRFAERISPDLEPELLYDYLKGRRPVLAPYHVEAKVSGNHADFAPYGLKVQDVCRVILDWKPHNANSPDANIRGIWVVVTVLPW